MLWAICGARDDRRSGSVPRNPTARQRSAHLLLPRETSCNFQRPGLRRFAKSRFVAVRRLNTYKFGGPVDFTKSLSAGHVREQCRSETETFMTKMISVRMRGMRRYEQDDRSNSAPSHSSTWLRVGSFHDDLRPAHGSYLSSVQTGRRPGVELWLDFEKRSGQNLNNCACRASFLQCHKMVTCTGLVATVS